jgi:two-component system sensor kinase FixL
MKSSRSRFRRHNHWYKRPQTVQAAPALSTSTEELVLLRRSHRRYIQLQRASKIGIWEWDLTSQEIICDLQMRKDLGLDEARVLHAAEFLEWISPEDRRALQVAIDAALADQRPIQQIVRLKPPSQEEQKVALQAHLDLTANDTPQRLIGSFRVLRSRRKEERMLHAVQRLAQVGGWSWEIATGEVLWTEMVYEILGLALHTPVTFDLIQQQTHPEDLPLLQERIEHTLKTGEAYHIVYRMFRCDNQAEIIIEGNGEVQYNEDGTPWGLIGSTRDVTEMQRQETELVRLNQKMLMAQKVAGLGLWEVDMRTGERHADTDHYKLFGIDTDAGLEQFMARVHADDRDYVIQSSQQTFSSGEPMHLTFRYAHPTRGERWIETHAQFFEDGEHKRLVGVDRDITTAKQQEFQLKAQLEWFQSVADLSRITPWKVEEQTQRLQLTSQGQWQSWELDEADKLRPIGELLPKILSRVHHDDREYLLSAISESFQNHQPLDVQYRAVTPTGDARVMRIKTAPVTTGAQSIIGVLQDVTELVQLEAKRREAEDMVLQSAKLASVGETAANIAHELRSPLAAVRMKAEMLQHGLIKPDQLPNRMKEIVQIVDKANSILQHIRDFSRMAESESAQPCYFRQILSDVLLIAGSSLSKLGVQIHMEVDPNLPPILGNPIKLEQVFLNLINNARDAMEESEPKILHISGEVAEGVVQIRLQDSGSGMTPEVRDKLFQSFFTTKAKGKGTGLGMSLVKRIVHEHYGHIDVDSALGEGTTFTLSFPARSSESIPAA